MAGYLNGMSEAGPGIVDSRKMVGKLSAKLSYEQDEIMQTENLMPFLDQSLSDLYKIHDAISNPMRLR